MSVFSEGYGRNDLQPAAVARCREIAEALDIVTRLGRLPKAMSAFKNFGRDSFPWGVAKW